MSAFSQELIGRSGYLKDGFAAIYDRYRPAPPREVLEILTVVAAVERPSLVVDLGCGTGVSTRAWAELADKVVGIEPNPRMIERARTATDQPNVRYVEAYGADTCLSAGRADLVTTFQSFHWMEPQPVLAEAVRILRGGGVFAACDYDVPPLVEPEVDAAFAALMQARREARQRLSIPGGATSWPKDRHLGEIRASGRFRHTRELVAHSWRETDAARTIGLVESIGGAQELSSEQAPEVDNAFERLREIAKRVLGDRAWPQLLCYRIRIGIK
jgi:SAM-dependent methyltransferase